MLMLGRLRKAIDKVAFLLSFDPTKWLAGSGYSRKRRQRISFRAHSGLLDLVTETDSPDAASISRTISSTWSGISRSTSNVSPSIGHPSRSSSLNDVDERAEEFIAKFRLHLLRENSLNLPYYHRRDSLEISSPVKVY